MEEKMIFKGWGGGGPWGGLSFGEKKGQKDSASSDIVKLLRRMVKPPPLTSLDC